MAKKKKNGICKDLLIELKIGSELIGYANDSAKVAVLNHKSFIKNKNRSLYNEKIDQLEKQGYKITYRPAEKSKMPFRERVYDVFDKI